MFFLSLLFASFSSHFLHQNKTRMTLGRTGYAVVFINDVAVINDDNRDGSGRDGKNKRGSQAVMSVASN
jgi:hypothetical protein